MTVRTRILNIISHNDDIVDRVSNVGVGVVAGIGWF